MTCGRGNHYRLRVTSAPPSSSGRRAASVRPLQEAVKNTDKQKTVVVF